MRSHCFRQGLVAADTVIRWHLVWKVSCITLITRVRHLILSWASWIQLMTSHPNFNINPPHHLLLHLSRGLSLSGFLSTVLPAHHYSATRATVPANICSPWLNYLNVIFRNVTPITIPVVKPTRCTSVSNLFYFRMTLYMFRTVFPSTIRSSRHCCRLASKQTAVSVWQMPVAVRTVLNSWWWTERPSETCRVSFQNKINLIHWCIWLVLL